MSVYSKPLARIVANPGSTDVYTVPAGKVAVVRDVRTILSSGDGPLRIRVLVAGTYVAALVFNGTGVSVGQGLECRIVLEAGEKLNINNLGSTQAPFYISGYELDA